VSSVKAKSAGFGEADGIAFTAYLSVVQANGTEPMNKGFANHFGYSALNATERNTPGPFRLAHVR
jgi:hypothetical protein